jgi:hypothetical protein
LRPSARFFISTGAATWMTKPPTRMVHRPTTPVPGTNGRGVSFVETDADLTLYVDAGEDHVGGPIVVSATHRDHGVVAAFCPVLHQHRRGSRTGSRPTCP